jgi:hypothetical protein
MRQTAKGTPVNNRTARVSEKKPAATQTKITAPPAKRFTGRTSTSKMKPPDNS